jgi:hypothetical protein
MRVRRALAAGLLALAGGTAVAILAAAPASAAMVGYVTLDPRSGPANTVINAQFQATPVDQGCAQITVIFTWDGHAVAAGKLNHCVALASFKPPSGYRRPGPHQVLATDDRGRVSFGSAIFVITIDPSATASPRQTSGSASPGRSRTAKATQTATDYLSDPPLSLYSGPSVDGTVAAVDAGTGGPPDNGSHGGGSSAMSVALTFGGALVLGGLLILGFIVFRGRREEPEYALTESPTQPIHRFPATFVPPPGADPAAPEDPWRREPPVPE